MKNTNYIGVVVKILETPIIKRTNSNKIVIKFRVQLPQVRKNRNLSRIVTLMAWGNLANTILNYYKINDYILIEGYISIRENKISDLRKKSFKKVTITLFKVYPFLLNSNRLKNKLF